MGVALSVACLSQNPVERNWPGEPFLLFVLVVIGTTLFFGTRLGFISLAVSTFLSGYFFEPFSSPMVHKTVDQGKIALYVLLALGCVVGFAYLGNALREAGDAEKNNSVLLREMMHGVTNSFATIATRSQTEQLRVLSAELRTIFHTAAVGITRCSRDLRYVAANETYAAIAGLPLSDIVGRSIPEVMGEEAFASIRPYVDRVLNGERVEYEAEIPWRGAKNGKRLFHVIYTPQRDAHDAVVGWVASVAEITHHKEIEADLRAQQERVAADLEAITLLNEVGNDCVRPGNDVEGCMGIILDTAMLLTKASKGNLQLLDSASGGLVIKVQRGFGKPFLDFFSHVHGQQSACGMAMLSKTRIVVEDVTESPLFAGKPARDVLLEAGVRAVQSTPLLSSANNLLGMLSTHFDRPTKLGDREARLLDLLARQAADYLERKQAEQRLRDSEQQAHEQFTELANLYQHAPVGLCLLDCQLRYLRINQRLAEMNGIPIEQHIGRKVHEVVPAVAATVEDVTRHILATGAPVVSQESHGETAAQPGVMRYWMESWYPVKDRQGSIYGFGVVVEEVTERKREEEQRHLLMREVNHRSKNLLSVVQAIAHQTAEGDPQVFVSRFGERLRSLASSHDLLVRGEWRTVSLESLVRSQLAHLQELVGTRILMEGANLSISPAAAQLIGMALHELATNASKYGALSTDHGRVTIDWKLDREEHRFQLRWSESGGPRVIAPTRRGFGSTFLEEFVKFNLDGHATLEYAATGLIWQLTCPTNEAIVSDRSHHGSATAIKEPPARPRVLVVEDEALTAFEITKQLKEAGFDVIGPAASVTQALRLLQEQSGCDAAVLDVNLRSETSEVVARRLSGCGTPFVTITGYSRLQLAPAFKAAPHLTKPVSSNALVETLRQYFE
jgi:PAS domain S-box-containing protein